MCRMDLNLEKNIEVKIAAAGRWMNLLVVINITLFVASGLVQGLKYYFPILALITILITASIILFPKTNLLSKKFYWIIFSSLGIATYLTVASIVYFVSNKHFLKINH